MEPKVGLNRPRERPGHPRGFRACFGSVFGSPGPPPKILGRPRGSPKSPPGSLRTPPRGAGRENARNRPSAQKTKVAPARLWRQLAPFWVASGGAFGAFLASFSHLRPKRETLIIHCKIQCFVRVRGSERRPKYVRRSSQKQGPKTRLRKAARARDFTPETAFFWDSLKTLGPPRGPQKSLREAARTRNWG